MQASNKAKVTAQMLENCGGMYREFERASGAKGVAKDPVAAPGVVKEGEPDRAGPVVRQTRELMARVRGVTVNDAAIKALPSSNVWQGSTPAEGPVVLDGWYNPIIFVPAGGLTGVTRASAVTTVTSPDGKAFFASAGPDGKFAAGDDNLYSFDD